MPVAPRGRVLRIAFDCRGATSVEYLTLCAMAAAAIAAVASLGGAASDGVVAAVDRGGVTATEARTRADERAHAGSAAGALVTGESPADAGGHATSHDDDCGWLSPCKIGRVARGVARAGAGAIGGAFGAAADVAGGARDFAVGLASGAWASVRGTAEMATAAARFGGRLLTGDRDAWALVARGAHRLVTDPGGVARDVGRVSLALLDSYRDALVACSTGFEARSCGEALGELAPDVILAVATGGSATFATRALRSADEVTDAARLARGARVVNVAGHLDDVRATRALEIMTKSSLEVSRTKKIARRFMAPTNVADDAIPGIAERNFRRAADEVVYRHDQLPLSRETAQRLNRTITDGLVPDDVRGQMNYRRDPGAFYDWLESDEARRLGDADPIALSERIHYDMSDLDAFPDGNGRTARLMADLALVKHGRAPAYYTDMADYFARGNSRAEVPRSVVQAYWREITARGQAYLDAPVAH